MPIDSLYFTNLGPFSEIQFDFNRQVNVFTGPNNSGKSTVLWALAELLVYPFSMPTKLYRSDERKWRLQYSYGKHSETIEGELPAVVDQLESTYMVLGHTSFVPAQRHSTDFRPMGPLLNQDINSRIEEEIIMWAQSRPSMLRDSSLEFVRQSSKVSMSSETPELRKRRDLMLTGATLISDRAVIQKIIDLDYAAYRQQKPAMKSIMETVTSIASDITEGFEIKFLRVQEDENGLFPEMSTPFGTVPYDVLSQGTKSMFQWLAHFLFSYAEYYDFPEDFNDKPAILMIDDIDAHLHPSWQRRIIPTLIRHFPKLQIFCSTHSPLMLAGLKEGQVQLLRLDNEHGVSVSTNEEDIVGWTADEILRNFLEVSDPTDYDTARNIKNLQKLRGKKNLSSSEQEELKQLEQTVRHQLLGGPGSDQIRQFARILEQAGIDVGNDSTSTDSDWRPTD